MTAALSRVEAALARHRFSLEDEKRTQNEIADVLSRLDGYSREVPVTGGIIDFLVDGVGIEVKIKGGAAAIRRQIYRYADDAKIEALVLLTSRPVAMPADIAGKPVISISMARAWL